uniref:Uncharacterized protein n=1 Tax=Ditylenchus dipsaci TaxID=166011 RepID=A0A915DP79_9BILA
MQLPKDRSRFLASNHEVEDLAKKFGSELDIGAIYSQGKPILWIKNAKKVIEFRLLRLHQSKQLQLDGKYGEKIFLFLVGDKGGSSTKIAVGIANVSSINSYENLIMVALFQGDDNYENMVALKEILFEQLNFPSVRVGDEEFSTKW